jgi:hypothetical protein
MDFSNPNQWQLVYLQNFTSDYFGLLQLPIATFDTPQITQTTIRVKVGSAEAKPSWNSGGNLYQIVDAGGVPSSIRNHSLTLNQDRVLILEPVSPYFLRFALPKWFTQATVTVFGFNP